MSQKEKNNNFIVQGAILGVAAIVVRVLGLLYQMPLTRIIGDMGNGYYSYAYNVYSMVLLISSFSIPIAVSKMVSERMVKHQYRNVQRVFKASMIYVMLISGVCALLTFIFAKQLLPESQAGAVPALRILCPVIFLSGVLGVLRGYFQGYNTMMPTSFSQILEGVLNAIISVLAAYILVIPFAAGSVKRATYGAVGSTLGTAAGVLIGLLFMLFVYAIYKPTIRKRVSRDRHSKVEDYGSIYKMIILTVTPVILSSAIYNICPVIDQTIFANILESKKIVGQDISVLQGIYSAKYLKLVSVPVSIASALSSAIIPAITANMVKKNMKAANAKIDMALKFTMLIALPSTIGLMVLARPIMLLFGRSTTLIVAVHVLIFGAVNVIFNCISTLTNAVLQGLGNMKAPMLHSVVALVVHIGVCVLFLEKGYGIYALLLGTMAFSLVIWILNAVAIYRITGYRKALGSKVWNILLASLEMGFVTFCIYQGLFLFLGDGKEFICLAVAMVVAVVSYLFFLFLANALTDEDYEMMPMGARIRNLGLRMHLIETEAQPFEEELAEIYEEEARPKKKFIFRKQEEDGETEEELAEPLNHNAMPVSEEEEPIPEQNVNLSEGGINKEDAVIASLLKTLQAEQGEGTVAEEKLQPIEEDGASMAEADFQPVIEEVTSIPDRKPQSVTDAIPTVMEEEDVPAKSQSPITGDTEPINVYEILQKFQKQEEEAAARLSEVKQSQEPSEQFHYVKDISSADYSQMSLEDIINAKPMEEKKDEIELLALDDLEEDSLNE